MNFCHLVFQLIITVLQLFILLIYPWHGLTTDFQELFTCPRKLRDLFAPPALWASTQSPSLPLLYADDFEHGLSNWDLARGKWLYWQVTPDGWLEAHLPNPNLISELVPKDEFWDPDWRNYRFEFEFQVLTSADRNWAWGYQGSRDWYELHFYQGKYHLLRLKDNSTVFYSSGWFSLRQDKIYQVAIEFNQGLIKVWLDGELLVERQDHTYEDNAGKIVLKATTGGAFPTLVRFDKVRVYAVEPSDDTVLSVSHFKQYHPAWRDNEYDHALSWSRWGDWQTFLPPHNQPPERTTIYHWGCALTSLAMVMNYYNLDKLPDGEVLNPATLNRWLKQQADGYIGEGGVNWLAGSRLSRLIREAHTLPGQNLPTLEFHRSYTPLTEVVKEMIDDLRPAILQIPGHFLVAHGYGAVDDQGQTDLIISDPAYNYTHLSQHNQSLVSVIDYQPTQTDLSYLMLVYPPELQLEVLDNEHQPIDQVSYAQETLADQFYDHEACLVKYGDQAMQNCFANTSTPIIQYLAKPNSGEFNLKITTNKNANNPLLPWQIFAYDEQGEVKMFDRLVASSLASFNNQTEETLALHFNKTDLSATTLQTDASYNFDQLSLSLETLLQAQQLQPYLYLRLKQLTHWAQTTTQHVLLERYAQLVLQLLKEFSLEITEMAKQELVLALVEA